MSKKDWDKLYSLLAVTDSESRPNLNVLNNVLKNVTAMQLNIKLFGYDLARRLAEALPPPVLLEPTIVGLTCKASTQTDIESDWAVYWAGQLHAAVIYHRKMWEFAYILQAIYENGHLVPGARGLGFGCGAEPIPSYLASKGVSVSVTDVARAEAESMGWAQSGQHLQNTDDVFYAHLVDREVFDANVASMVVDMNAIPADLGGYDFCWSTCAMEHLGSIAAGLAFVKKAVRTVKPGGLCVHTMEYNIDPHGATIDNWPTVLFQRRHLEALAAELRAEGHEVAEFDFDLGDKPMDKFIDLPPWGHDLSEEMAAWVGDSRHLKLGIDGFVATCFGIVVRRAAA